MKMLIEMKSRAAGPDFTGKPGQRIEVTAERGKALVAGGYAVAVEKAVKKPAENTSGDPGSETETTNPSETREATGAAKALMEQLKINPADVTATGAAGQIVKSDVEEFLAKRG